MLKVKQLKQGKIFEISLTESQIYKTLQTSAIIREISDSNLETEVLTDLTEKSGWVVESIMVRDFLVYYGIATSVTV